MLRIKAFGGFAVHRGEERVLGAAAQPRRMALLAMVARAGPQGVSRDRLLATLWPDAGEAAARQALKQAIYALRRDAGVGEFLLGTREIVLNPDEASADVAEFTELLGRRRYERAVALWDGPFLDGFRLPAVPEFEYWIEDERRALEAALAEALEQLARSARAAGDAVRAVTWLRRRVALDPLSERLTVDLMEALLAADDRAGALQQARVYEGLIGQQFDLAPHPTVIDLARRIREGGETSAARTPAAPTPPAAAGPDSTRGAAERPDPAVVAVLPFTWLSADEDAGGLAEGLREELLSALARRSALRVLGRLPLSGADAHSIAALGAGAVVEGSVRRAGDAVRVTGRLLRVPEGSTVWTDRFDRRADRVLEWQEDLAEVIAAATERAVAAAAGRVGGRDRADALYSAGLRAWSPEGAGLGQGLDLFRQAIAAWPEHAEAHAALAESYTQLAFYGFLPAARAAALASAAAEEAMRLAPGRAESRLARGTCLLWVDRDFSAGAAALEEALAIDPGLVAARARLAFVRLCHDGPAEAGRTGAEDAATGARATGMSRVMYGQQLLAARRFDAAIDALHAAIDIEAPSFLAYHWLTIAYIEQGRGAEAVTAAVAEASLSGRHPWSLLSLVAACAADGQRRRAEALLETLEARAVTEYVQASVLAQARAALGDVERGMTLLERAVDERDPSTMMLRWFPMFAPFHGHPRFGALLHRAGWRDWDATGVGPAS